MFHRELRQVTVHLQLRISFAFNDLLFDIKAVVILQDVTQSLHLLGMSACQSLAPMMEAQDVRVCKIQGRSLHANTPSGELYYVRHSCFNVFLSTHPVPRPKGLHLQPMHR
jgi:hypothetical protein